ncbi:hypothetical protein LPJ78_004941, partial [Coemansia sp. RSA 989]
MELSAGEIAKIKMLDNGCSVTTPVTLQVISNLQPFGNQNAGPLRFRCMASDGEQSIVMVLPVHLTALVDEQKICRYTVLKVQRYNFTKKKGPNDQMMSFIIVGDAEIVGTATDKLGSPEKLGMGSAAQPSAMAAPQQPQQQQ